MVQEPQERFVSHTAGSIYLSLPMALVCILSIGKGGSERVGVSSYWVRLDSALQGIAECPVLSLHGEE